MPPAGPRAAALSLEILGRTVLDRTIDTLKALPGLDRLIVGEVPIPLRGNGTVNSPPPPGGSGQHLAVPSPLRGGGNDTVLVCNPDRPLLTLAMLTEFLEKTHSDRVAALVCPASDTYKTVLAGTVASTLDRGTLWELQGLSRFNHGSFNSVQDLEAAHAAGIPVRLVQGDPMNFAVRTTDDCRVAELVLSK